MYSCYKKTPGGRFMLLVLYVRMCFFEYLSLRLTNRGGQRQ